MKESVIPPSVIEHLIALGKAQDADSVADLLELLRPFGRVGGMPWDCWNAVTAEMTEEQHAALARGLVIAEERLRWTGGSVASAIWVYQSYERKFPASADPLADWMLKNSNNPWVPFITPRGTIRSVAEFRAFEKQKAERRDISAKETRVREEIADARRATTARLHTLRESVSKAESAARKALLAELADLPLHDRLMHLALDGIHPLDYYPPSLASGDHNQLGTSGRWALQKVADRAREIRRGPWRRWLKTTSCSDS